MSISGTPFLNDKRNVVESQEATQSTQKECILFNQKHYLKCGSCLWKTAYTDLTGFLDISGKAVRCPACNTGIIKVNETPQGHNEDYIPVSYLDFVLSDW
jgi:hypothetical protein